MLRYFNAALSQLSRARPFDHLASMAELVLDASAVAFVDLHPRPALIGVGEQAEDVDPAIVEAAAAVRPIDPAALADGPDRVPGTPLDLAPPFARVVNLPMVCACRPVLCMVFPVLPGVRADALVRFMDVGKRHLSENALTQRYRADLRRYVTMFRHMERMAKIGVWEMDLATQELSWSDEVFRIFELPAGRTPSVAEAMRCYPEPGRTELRNAFQELQLNGTPLDLTLPFHTASEGHRRTVRVIASLERTPDGGERIAGVFQDVTVQQETTERLWWTANHDALTGLPNRALFSDRFRKALERSRRTGRRVCLVLVDVDAFKDVNDTLGHGAGDTLLELVAARLTDSVRRSDTVARTGGDEFSILLEDVTTTDTLEGVLGRVRAALDVRLDWEERTRMVTLSAGAAIAPDHGMDERTLTSAADLALYRMKDEPRAALAVYDPALGEAAEARSRLFAEARQALLEGRFVPFYQPQVDIASGDIVGVEALARWVDADGVRDARDFAEVLEDHDLGSRIGAAVADRAIAEIARLNRNRTSKIALSINASAGELVRRSFLKRVGRHVSGRGPDAGPITVEINETVILDDPDGALAEEMRRAEKDGVTFSLDHFGTGGSSLLQITAWPISEVKVDRSFVAGLEADGDKQRVIRGIIEAARSLGLRLIVEGVETEEQVHCINALGGRFAQGFFYSRAVPADALERLLDRAQGSLGEAA